MLKKFFEYIAQSQFEPIKSFYLQDELHPELWDNFKLDEEVRDSLIQIGQDFYDKLDLDNEVVDIVLCGSLCNYNWSEKYSDFDLHVIVNYDDLGDDHGLLDKMFDFAKKEWNSDHDIVIKGFDVEIAVQDEEVLYEEIEQGKMGGVYSLIKNKWIKKPEKVAFVPDEKMIRKKAENLMEQIKSIEEDFENGATYDELIDRISKVWKKIKEGRRRGLEEGGEFAIENLVFKLLRRNEYITRLMQVRKKAYDKQFK